MSQLPSIVTFTLDFSDINKDNCEGAKIIFNRVCPFPRVW